MGAEAHCPQKELKDNSGVFLCEDSGNLHDTLQQQSRKHIIIFATTRSGSSFLGQLFNQHPQIFYLFEPLYHVQQAFTNSSARVKGHLDRRALLGAYRDLLHNLYDCDFNFLENYIKPVPRDHETFSFFRRGASNALCSKPVCENLPVVEEHLCAKRCRAVNLTLASKACHARRHIAIKTVRIPEINDIRTLAEDPRLNLKIIHLVRDPRGIITSRIGTFTDQFRSWKIWNTTGRKPHSVDLSHVTTTCEDLSKSAETGFNRPSWLKGKYMLVRYEDLARLNTVYVYRAILHRSELTLDPLVSDFRNWKEQENTVLSEFQCTSLRGNLTENNTENEALRLSLLHMQALPTEAKSVFPVEIVGYVRPRNYPEGCPGADRVYQRSEGEDESIIKENRARVVDPDFKTERYLGRS
ncbi:hypothetical protein NDU88_005773 [Pleurodeles waltl]|uniref:Sulfotransferase n=1 Tax=Pleurodeles waltl TaxID=8319 RepID=A0AAV7SMU4_PLEWA|nr:hypothetical protein NDU88_005773 [Pleurodeles waltl]